MVDVAKARDFGIKIRTGDGEYIFDALTDTARDQWVVALREAKDLIQSIKPSGAGGGGAGRGAGGGGEGKAPAERQPLRQQQPQQQQQQQRQSWGDKASVRQGGQGRQGGASGAEQRGVNRRAQSSVG